MVLLVTRTIELAPTTANETTEARTLDSWPTLANTAPSTGTVPLTGRSTSYQDDKDKILTRLRRIEGQVRGVQRMIEADQYCIDVLTQLSSIIAATRATGLLVLEDHIRGCVIGAAEDEREAVLAELTTAIDRFNRTIG